MHDMSRRRVLQGLGVLAGGAAVAGASSAGAAAAAPSSGGQPSSASPLVLYGSGLRALGPRGRKVAGDTVTVRGGISAAPDGEAVGEVFATGTVLGPSSSIAPDVGVFETQLFVLPEGSLTGTGTVSLDGTGEFVVTGGTGSYAGASGSYRTRQSADPVGGGTAEYTFTILNAGSLRP